jgi:hypothetical protein
LNSLQWRLFAAGIDGRDTNRGLLRALGRPRVPEMNRATTNLALARHQKPHGIAVLNAYLMYGFQKVGGSFIHGART